MSVNDELILEYNYFDNSHNINKIPGTEQLNNIKLPQQLSKIKYIYSNTVQDENSAIGQIIKFVNGMLYFKSLLDGNKYMGYRLGPDNLSEKIIKQNKLPDFQKFLNDMGLNYNLTIINNAFGQQSIGVIYKKRVLDFAQIISSVGELYGYFTIECLNLEI